MSSTFTYSPLTCPDRQIRLLQPVAECSPEAQSWSLAVVDTENACNLEYIAVSYCWGDAAPTFPLRINGKCFRVRWNCWHALWQILRHGCNTSVWIDAICINQEDDDEKGHQVGMMGPIFASAIYVASCLGPGNLLGLLTSATTNGDADYAFEELDALPYLNRLWVKQEIVLARDVRFYCGVETMTWQYLFLSLSVSTSVHWSFPWRSKEHKLFQLSEHRSVWRTGTRSMDIIQLLEKYGDAKCSEPKDKVYALLSLLPECDALRRALIVDYNQSPFTFLCNVTRLVFNSRSPEAADKFWPINYDGIRLHRAMFALSRWLKVYFNDQDVEAYLRSRHDPQLAQGPLKLSPSAPRINLTLRALTTLRRLDRSLVLVETDTPSTTELRHLDGSWGLNPGLNASTCQSSPAFGIINHGSRGVVDLIVDSDVRPDDLLVDVMWTCTSVSGQGWELFDEPWRCAVLRQTQDPSRFYLHSWAIPSRSVKDFGRHRYDFINEYAMAVTVDDLDALELSLAYHDIFPLTFLSQDPIQAIFHPASTENPPPLVTLPDGVMIQISSLQNTRRWSWRRKSVPGF